INDNSPQFKEESINLEIRESAARGARFVIEEAHDADELDREKQQEINLLLTALDGGSPQRSDEGVNGDVTYEFGHVTEDVKKIFNIDRKVGEIRVVGAVDYETTTSFEIRVKAKDGLGLSSYSKAIIHITDVNDNAPAVNLKSLTNPIPEDTLPGTESNPLIRDFLPLVSTAERSGHSGTFL
ncbi:hypothetical protein FQN60_010276, partial [Etheostoma spectabile]